LYGTTYILLVISFIAFIISIYYIIFKKDVIKKLEGGGKAYFYFGFVVCSLILIFGIIYLLITWLGK
jgi:hypothetical protein